MCANRCSARIIAAASTIMPSPRVNATTSTTDPAMIRREGMAGTENDTQSDIMMSKILGRAGR